MQPTWQNLKKRAAEAARDAMPSIPKLNTQEAWEAFAEELEQLDTSDLAHFEADSWDWVIYYGQAMELCTQVPSSVLEEAEEMVRDVGNVAEVFAGPGLYGVACACAYWVVFNQVFAAMEELRTDMLELAQNQVDNLEGAA